MFINFWNPAEQSGNSGTEPSKLRIPGAAGIRQHQAYQVNGKSQREPETGAAVLNLYAT